MANFRHFALACAFLAGLTTAATAQVTTCREDKCTVEESDGKKRELTPAEVGKIMRGNSRTAIGNVQCRHATDPQKCEKMLSELWVLFPL